MKSKRLIVGTRYDLAIANPIPYFCSAIYKGKSHRTHDGTYIYSFHRFLPVIKQKTMMIFPDEILKKTD